MTPSLESLIGIVPQVDYESTLVNWKVPGADGTTQPPSLAQRGQAGLVGRACRVACSIDAGSVSGAVDLLLHLRKRSSFALSLIKPMMPKNIFWIGRRSPRHIKDLRLHLATTHRMMKSLLANS